MRESSPIENDSSADQRTTSGEELRVLMSAAQQGDSAAYTRVLQAITERVRQVVRQQRGFAGTAADVTFADPHTNTNADVYESTSLRAAVERLPAGQREAIELLKLRELSLREASSLTGTSIGALKVATHRALAALRKALTKTDVDDH